MGHGIGSSLIFGLPHGIFVLFLIGLVLQCKFLNLGLGDVDQSKSGLRRALLVCDGVQILRCGRVVDNNSGL